MEIKEQLIQKAYERSEWLIENNYPQDAERYLEKIAYLKAILEEKEPIPLDFNQVIENYHYSAFDFLRHVLHDNFQLWSVEMPLIKALISPNYLEKTSYFWLVKKFIEANLAKAAHENEFDNFIGFLHRQGFTDEKIVDLVLTQASGRLLLGYKQEDDLASSTLSYFGSYLLKLLKGTGVFFLSRNNSKAVFLHKLNTAALEINSNIKNQAFELLLDYFPEGLNGLTEKYLSDFHPYHADKKSLNLGNLLLLLDNNAGKYEKLVAPLLSEFQPELQDRFSIFLKLRHLNPAYETELEEIARQFYEIRCKTAFYGEDKWGFLYEKYVHYSNSSSKPVSIAIADYLLEKNEAAGKERIAAYLKEADFLSPDFLTYLSERFRAGCLPYLSTALFKDAKYLRKEYFSTLFEILERNDFSQIQAPVWNFAENHANKATRELATTALASLGNPAFDKASELLHIKKAGSRMTGALVLAKLNTEASLTRLQSVLDTEKDDATRDIILESLTELLYGTPLTLEAVKAMVAAAGQRGKLARFSEKHLVENELPPLFWLGNGTKLNQEEMRFIFYRMSRRHALASDVELRQVLALLDKNKSGNFAKKLVQAFLDTGSDTKFKHYLVTAGQIGGDEIIAVLHTVFRKNMTEKRYKMAEYAVEALAMVGTNKALRTVEVISRKFAGKRPNVSRAAIHALEAAASLLGITKDELADRIIPDFGFEGLFRSFDVGDEEYRAFINADFTLCFFDEDNKLRKSVPKNTPADLKKEFKETEKEVREIAKSQSSRLEKYLIEERQWTSPQWQALFLQNPVMFIYAMKLLWGVFDATGNFKTAFYCNSDTSCYTLENEEPLLEATDYIAILHPFYLTANERSAWQEKLFNLDFAPLFPQLERRVFQVLPEEKDKSYTRFFVAKDVPKGADFVLSTIEKYGWLKSRGDGGHVYLIKENSRTGHQATADIDGVYFWYQGETAKATVQNIHFFGKNQQDKITLADLPPVFYSEVMYDIDRLIEAE